MKRDRSSDAVSQVQGVLILVAITIILALLLLLMLHLPLWTWEEKGTPEIFAITDLIHVSEKGVLNYDSRVVITHIGTAVFQNDQLRAEIFVNDANSGARITTMNAHLFIKTYHIGVQHLWGLGSTSIYWYPGERIHINMNDGTFRPGDRIRLDVYEKIEGNLISRSEKIA